MISDLVVRTGPEVYQMGEGVLDGISKHLQSLKIKKILVLHGEIGWAKAQPYMQKFLKNQDFEISYLKFNGECSYVEVNRVADYIRTNDCDYIMGVGGGKLCDVAKYAASNAQVKGGTIPTLASNCAPWTPLSVMYTEDHRSEGGYELLPQQLNLCLIEPRIILDSPKKYFIAGIADTLAKWYESDLILQDEKLSKEPMLMMARQAALICRDMIKEHGDQAIADMEANIASDSFLKMIEVVIPIAGLVGGLGDDYARSTGAHTMHDSITQLRVESHDFLHGEKVAYGVFFELAVEEKWSEIEELQTMYNNLELPQSLAQMNIKDMTEASLDELVARILIPGERIHSLPLKLTEEWIKQAIIDLDFFIDPKNETFAFNASSQFKK